MMMKTNSIIYHRPYKSPKMIMILCCKISIKLLKKIFNKIVNLLRKINLLIYKNLLKIIVLNICRFIKTNNIRYSIRNIKKKIN